MERSKETRSVTIRAKIVRNGITEEEVFDNIIDSFRKFGKDFKLQVSGRDKDLEEKHIN